MTADETDRWHNAVSTLSDGRFLKIPLRLELPTRAGSQPRHCHWSVIFEIARSIPQNVDVQQMNAFIKGEALSAVSLSVSAQVSTATACNYSGPFVISIGSSAFQAFEIRLDRTLTGFYDRLFVARCAVVSLSESGSGTPASRVSDVQTGGGISIRGRRIL